MYVLYIGSPSVDPWVADLHPQTSPNLVCCIHAVHMSWYPRLFLQDFTGGSSDLSSSSLQGVVSNTEGWASISTLESVT